MPVFVPRCAARAAAAASARRWVAALPMLCLAACGGGSQAPGSPSAPTPSTGPSTPAAGAARFSHLDRPHVLLKNPFALPSQSDQYLSMRPRGPQPLLVILLELPDSPHDPAHDRAYFEDLIFGRDPSVRGYFEEVSYGRFTVTNGGIAGWYRAPRPTGAYFGGLGPDYTKLGADAVEAAAAAGFSFRAHDRNGDRIVGPDELLVLVVLSDHPHISLPNLMATRQDQQRDLGVLTPEGIEVDAYAIRVEEHWANRTRETHVAYYAHELGHAALGLPDLYSDTFGGDPSAPFCLMTVSGGSVPHINPWAKIHLGWIDPVVVERSGRHSLPAAESAPAALIVHVPTRGVEEYFVLENRWPASSRYETLGSRLPDQGLAIWHITESHFREPFDLNLGRKVVAMKWAGGEQALRASPVRALWDGADPASAYDFNDDSSPRNARWEDGSRSGIQLRAFSPAGPTIQVDITIPGS